MDEVISRLASLVDDHTVLYVLGDHGMTPSVWKRYLHVFVAVCPSVSVSLFLMHSLSLVAGRSWWTDASRDNLSSLCLFKGCLSCVTRYAQSLSQVYQRSWWRNSIIHFYRRGHGHGTETLFNCCLFAWLPSYVAYFWSSSLHRPLRHAESDVFEQIDLASTIAVQLGASTPFGSLVWFFSFLCECILCARKTTFFLFVFVFPEYTVDCRFHFILLSLIA